MKYVFIFFIWIGIPSTALFAGLLYPILKYNGMFDMGETYIEFVKWIVKTQISEVKELF